MKVHCCIKNHWFGSLVLSYGFPCCSSFLPLVLWLFPMVFHYLQSSMVWFLVFPLFFGGYRLKRNKGQPRHTGSRQGSRQGGIQVADSRGGQGSRQSGRQGGRQSGRQGGRQEGRQQHQHDIRMIRSHRDCFAALEDNVIVSLIGQIGFLAGCLVLVRDHGRNAATASHGHIHNKRRERQPGWQTGWQTG